MKYLFFLFFASTLYSQTIGWQKNLEISIDGKNRYYDVYIPNDVKSNPELVIQLHGGTQNKNELHSKKAGASKFWKEVADKEKFILIVPNGTDTDTGEGKGDKLNWNDCRIHLKDFYVDDVKFISDLIDLCVQNFTANSKKVFVTGVSNGGLMCYRLALEIPNKITAIASFNANLYKESECKVSGIPIPVMIVNGKKDAFMPFYGGKTKYRDEDALSSRATVDFWVKNNKLENAETSIIKIGKNKEVTHTLFGNQNSKNQVSYYEIENEGHTMPGKKYVLSRFIQRFVGKQNQDFEGAEMAWEFFKTQSK